ncbi:TPA: Lrp/AsnC family transcriptional regulator [Candidatus Bathyarchaeota archaeon]|nr:Lrp/AsnC family transcriptional regulator [Candidatus Bathyarchaeota archaeon]HIJ08192.1 Lrp/AsnC family transcriptional regulator [Candidatus Bathyarchaeota archaeon]
METGYILFSLKPGQKKDFILRIRKVKHVKEARLVLGNWDAIAKVEAEDVKELEKVFFNNIDKIPGLASSRLYIKACPRTRK